MDDDIDIGQEIENGFNDLGNIIKNTTNTARDILQHLSPILLPFALLGAQQAANQNGQNFDPWQNPYQNENNEGTSADESETGTPAEQAPGSTNQGPAQEPSGEPAPDPAQPAPQAGSRGGADE